MIEKKIGWKFDNTYSNLSENMLSKLKPTPVRDPKLIIFNYNLSRELGLDFSEISDKEKANIFSGNQIPKGTETFAQAYAGHQFGQFTVLGDGRALIVGEHINKKNKRFDIQFKGSGKTPYSRNADGRAALGPMLREYIISEAMHALGIKTSRSLAVVETGEKVIREKILNGAVLTRVASSHIRVGTFQFALISKNKSDLNDLLNYTINRHFPHLKSNKEKTLELLKIVQEKQINLICDWMRVGFVHGVMNTDNMTISGETIDYGPCAFMDRFDPNTVFSSIDLHGRYSYFNQPNIALWNLERFAEALLPLIDKDQKKSISLVKKILSKFPSQYEKNWVEMMKNKLGIIGYDKKDKLLISELLKWMQKKGADYTNTFCYLMGEFDSEYKIFRDKDFSSWKKKWSERRKVNNSNLKESLNLMKKFNPLIIPRNYYVEDALNDAINYNFSKIKNLLEVLSFPYKRNKNTNYFQLYNGKKNEKYVTFCGT